MAAGEERLHQKFRLGPLFRASYSSLPLVSTNLPREQAHEINQAPTARPFPKITCVSHAKSRGSDRRSLAHVANIHIPTIPANSIGRCNTIWSVELTILHIKNRFARQESNRL